MARCADLRPGQANHILMALRDNPVIYLAAKTWQYSKGNRRSVVLFIILFTVANSIALLETLLVAFILNTLQSQGLTQSDLPRILLYLSLIILINVLFWAFHGPARVLETANAFRVRANYKEYLLQGTMALPVAWHTDHHSGDTIDKIEKGTGALYNFATDSFMVIESLVSLVGAYIALVYFNVNSVYIVFVMVVLALWIILRFDKVLIAQYRELFRAENSISAKVYDALSNITTVIILRVEKLVLLAIKKKMIKPLALFVKNSKVNEVKWFLVTVCSTLMTFLVLGSYLYTHIRVGAVLAIGTIYALYGYVQKINELFYRFAYMYGDMERHKTAVMNAEEVAKEFRRTLGVREVAMGPSWRALSIEGLSFSYHTEEGADVHLDDVSLRIERGKKIALVGESGSGKTTLLKIIRGLYEPRAITVRLDGKKLPKGFTSISSRIALIPQEPEIFATTIRENITIGVDRSIKEIKVFTNMARFTDVAERLPKKFESSIVEKGVNLSGGEKQRLALARGLLACEDKAIILLDEPTSSVDYKNELDIYQNIFAAFTRQAIVSSVHRLHLLPLFDAVYVFADGRVIASGSFDELLETSAPFQAIWEKYNSTLPAYER